MKDSEDDAIDRVLEGLRTAQPHDGLAQRVNLGLERRQAEALLLPNRGGLFSRRTGVALALASAVLAVAITGILRQPKFWHPVAIPVGHLTAQTTRSTPQRAASAEESARNSGAPSHHKARIARQGDGPAQLVPAAPTQTATRDAAYLPSFPAPEAPLTEQERLLLRIAHHPDPSDLALLNPEKREELAAVNAKDFQKFFNPPQPEEKK